jgi:hypothetical protein
MRHGRNDLQIHKLDTGELIASVRRADNPPAAHRDAADEKAASLPEKTGGQPPA